MVPLERIPVRVSAYIAARGRMKGERERERKLECGCIPTCVCAYVCISFALTVHVCVTCVCYLNAWTFSGRQMRNQLLA